MNKKIILILFTSITILVVMVSMEFYSIINEDFLSPPKKQSKIGIYLYFICYLIVLWLIYIISNKKKPVVKKPSSVIHIIKTLIASYMIAGIFWALLIFIAHLLDSSALINFAFSKSLLIIFVVMVFSYPIIVRRLR